MKRPLHCSLLVCAAGVLWWPLCLLPAPVRADETLALARPIQQARGVVLAIADTSAAATLPVATRPVLTRASRPGCPAGRVYWRRGGGPPPPCESPQWVAAATVAPAQGMRCAAAAGALAARGHYVAHRLRQWDARARQWSAPVAGARTALECDADAGRHGAEPGTWYARDGSSPWSRTPDDEIAWHEDAAPYTLYSSAYVAGWHAPARVPTPAWDVLRGALALLGDATFYDTALLRHSWNDAGTTDAAAEGGMVIAAARGTAAVLLTALRAVVPGGGAPWTETLYEAVLQLRGERVDFGLRSRATPAIVQPSVRESREPSDPARYASPWAHACSRAHLLAAVAGAPSQDAAASSRLRTLSGFDVASGCTAGTDVPCLESLLRFVATRDHAPLPGMQRADVAWLAPGDASIDAGAAATFERWALAAADRYDALPLAVEWLAAARFAAPGTAAAPPTPQMSSLATGGGEAYAGGFVPDIGDRWGGVLRRLGAPGTSFVPGEPARRRVYTDLTDAPLSAPANALAVENAALDTAQLGLVPAEGVRRARTIAWARGADTEDEDGDGDVGESRAALGAIVGGSVATVRHAAGLRVYAGTGDGFLHAFDSAGTERWAFVPRAFLQRLDELRLGRTSGRRHAGLDGELRVLVVDRNRDGVVDAASGDRALLYFGLRRGGRAYVAVDVTDPDTPRRAWTLTPRELPGLAQTWATPVPARLSIAGAAQNADRRVLLLAGGHDPAEDSPDRRPRAPLGTSLYLVDAYTGVLLWHASGRAADSPDLAVAAFDRPVAATPRALDLDEDGELDRVYAVDTDGDLVRIDFRRGRDRASLATATHVAALGGEGRRFHAEPDVALERPRTGNAYLAIMLGSGFAPDPAAPDAANRLYSIRDPLTRGVSPAIIDDASLPEATNALPDDAPGWKLSLAEGERIVVGARTIDHVAYVPSYTPTSPAVAPDCTHAAGTNRVYAMDVRNARGTLARTRGASDGERLERSQALDTTGVAPALQVYSRTAADCTSNCAREVVALVGLESVDVRWPGRAVRTGWAERDVE